MFAKRVDRSHPCGRVSSERRSMNIARRMKFPVFQPWLRCAALLGLCLLSSLSLSAASPRAVPNFALLDLHGRNVELARAEGKAVVLFFTGVGCPIARKSTPKLQALADQFRSKGVSFWIINTYPDDSLKDASSEAWELGLRNFTYLRDPRQMVALALNVERTAEVVVIELAKQKVVYQGAIDDQFTEGAERPQPQTKFLETALDEFLDGRPVSLAQTPARGCRIAYSTAAEASKPPSYAGEIAPLLRRSCVECHREGGIGPWAMDSHGRVRNQARMIEEVLLTRRMPPYDVDPDIGRFANAHRLTRDETQSLLRWIAAGAPRGDGPDPLANPLPPRPDWPMGRPDFVLRLPKPEEIPATGVLEYRHIPLPAPSTNELWLSGVDIQPGNRRVVHHAILYAQWPGCPDDGSGHGVHVFGWAPGATPASYPAGVGKRIPAGATYTLEMHYTPNGSPQTDQTEVALYLRPGPQERNTEIRHATQYAIQILPGDSDSSHLATYAFEKPATLYSLSPHMHVRGKWMKYELLSPDGRRKPLLLVPRYDFKWQQTYRLAEPLQVPAGSWLMVTGAFDNSAGNPSNPDPTRTVAFGLQSWEEMFIGFFEAADEPTHSGAPSGGGH